jgi:chromosome segregation ATPase
MRGDNRTFKGHMKADKTKNGSRIEDDAKTLISSAEAARKVIEAAKKHFKLLKSDLKEARKALKQAKKAVKRVQKKERRLATKQPTHRIVQPKLRKQSRRSPARHESRDTTETFMKLAALEDNGKTAATV